MKRLTGWVVLAGLLGTAGAANAQMLAPYRSGNSPYMAASDVGGPYAAMPPELPAGRYGPTLLPAQEVYTVVRESGFSPLGIPQQRGLVYTIAVVDRGGEDGRLVIDARTGRILRFVPADRMGDRFNETTYVPAGPLPPVNSVTRSPQSPKPAARVASRTTPVPKPSPLATKPVAEPARQSAAVQPKPAEPAAAPAAVTTGAAPIKPEVQIAPTQEMPKAMGLE